MTLSQLFQRAFETIRDPKAGADWALGLPLSRQSRWEILTLIVVINTMLILVTQLVIGSGDAGVSIFLGAGQFVLMVLSVFGVHFVGRAFGGTGEFDGAITIIAWLQFVLMVLQIAQVFFLVALPFVAQLIGFAAFFLTFHMLSNFIAVLHGFKSIMGVLLGILATLFAFAFVMTIGLAIFGIEFNPAW